MRASLRSRAAVASVAAGALLALSFGGAAYAQYSSGGGTTTTTSTSTTSTSTTSTSTTSTSTTSTSIGASPGTTTPTGSGNSEKVGVSSNTVAPGSSVTTSVASQPSPSGAPGPCAPGSRVSLSLQLLQNGVAPVTLNSTAQANSSGGLSPVSVTIPSSAPQGTYVLYAQCSSPSGILEILTSPVVLVTSGSAHVALAPADFATSSSYGTPQERAAIDHAVRAQIAKSASSSGSATEASGLPNGGLNLAVPHLTLAQRSHPGTSRALSYGLSAAVLALLAGGLWTLRRRRHLTSH